MKRWNSIDGRGRNRGGCGRGSGIGPRGILCLLGAALTAGPALWGIEDIPEGQTVLIQGSSAAGHLNTNSGGFQVFGTLRLESRDGGYTSALTVTNGMLTNTLTGLIEVNRGSGGARSISADLLNLGAFSVNYSLTLGKTNGVYYNAGAFTIASNQTLSISGQNPVFNQNGGTLQVDGAMDLTGVFNYNGGILSGNPPCLVNSTLTLAPAATQPASFTLTGDGSLWSGDLKFGQTIWVQGGNRGGHTHVTTTNGWRNEGLVQIRSVDGGYISDLRVTGGTLTNGPRGIVSIEAGTGGERRLTADILNQGTLSVGVGTIFDKAGARYENVGSINVAAGQTLSIEGGGSKVFDQTAGTVKIGGLLRLTGTTFNFRGGEIAGPLVLTDGVFNFERGNLTDPVSLVQSPLVLAPEVVIPVFFTLSGDSSAFVGDLKPGQTLWVQGGNRGGHTLLTTTNGWRNEGLLQIRSVDGAYISNLRVTAGTFTNGTKGTVSIEAGAGGERRLTADILNQGTFSVGSSTTFDKAGGRYENVGALHVAAGQTLSIVGGGGQVFNQTAGTVKIDGLLRLTGTTLNFRGGEIAGAVDLTDGAFNFERGNLTDPAYLVRSSLALALEVAIPVFFTLSGDSSAFVGELKPGQTLWVQGGNRGGHTLLTTTNGWRNDGLLQFRSVDGAYVSNLRVTAGTFTNGTKGTVSIEAGAGGERRLTADILNQGTISVGSSTIWDKAGGRYENVGSINVATGQTLSIEGGGSKVFDQTAGAVKSDGLLRFTGATLNLRGGEITGALDITGGVLNFQRGNLTGPAYLAQSRLVLAPAAVSSVFFTLSGDASAFVGELKPGQTLWVQGGNRGGHTLLTTTNGWRNESLLRLCSIDGAYASGLRVTDGTFTNGTKGTVSIEAGAGGERRLTADILNQGTISVGSSTIWDKAGGRYENVGSIAVAAGQTLSIEGGGSKVFDQTAGAVKSGGLLRLTGATLNLRGGEITGALDITGGVLNFQRGNLTGPAYLAQSRLVLAPEAVSPVFFTLVGDASAFAGDLKPGQTLLVQGGNRGGHTLLTTTNGWRNDGWLQFRSIDGSYGSSLRLTAGTLTNGTQGTVSVEAGAGGDRKLTADILNQGVFNVTSSLNCDKAGGQFVNAGSVNLAAGATLSVAGGFAQLEGISRLNGGTLSVGGPVKLPGGSLTGAGTVQGQVTSAAVVSPGGPFGVLNVQGDYTQEPAGVLEIEIGGRKAGVEHDQLQVTGNAQIGGRLRVLLAGGFVPNEGDAFVVLQAGSVLGAFATFDLPALPDGRTWEVTSAPQVVGLRVSVMANASHLITGTVRDTQGNPISGAKVYGSLETLSYQGLRGEYFDNVDFTNLKLARLDPVVNFDWSTGVPATNVGADTFSVRWTGFVKPLYTETYTFYTVTDDGIRLWIDGRLIINNWGDHGATENSGSVALTNGVPHEIAMEFYENGGFAVAKLLWSSPSQPKEVIPAAQLTPSSTTNLEVASRLFVLVSDVTAANGRYGLNVSNGLWTVGVEGLPTLGYEDVSNRVVQVENNNPAVNFVAQPFSGQRFHLTLESDPSDAGILTGAGPYAQGATVTVSAGTNTAVKPYQFVGWFEIGLPQSADPEYAFVVTRDRHLLAQFTLPRHQIAASNSPPLAGSVSGTGAFTWGTTNLLTARPAAGYLFTQWTEDGVTLGTNQTLSLILRSNRFVVAHYIEANPVHDVATATAPTHVVPVAGAGTYTNGQTAAFSLPAAVTNGPLVYTFKRYLLNGVQVSVNPRYQKTFSTLDPAQLTLVAEYESRTVLPRIVEAFGSVTNAITGGFNAAPNPVRAMTNYQLTLRFDRSMDAKVEPVIQLTNRLALVRSDAPTGGVWTATVAANDTYRTPFLLLSPVIEGTNEVMVSRARDIFGAVLETTNVFQVILDTTPPAAVVLRMGSSNSASATLAWTNYTAPADLSGFRVYLEKTNFTSAAGLTPLTALNASSRAFQFSGLGLDTNYYAGVAAIDVAGNSAATLNPFQIRLSSTVPPPVSLRLIPVGANAARVSWTNYDTAPLFGFAGFRLYVQENRFSSVQGLQPLADYGPEERSATVEGLDRSKNYYLAVVGYNRLNGLNPQVTPVVWSDPFAGLVSADLTIGGPGITEIDIYQTITVTNNATLTILPGTTLRFAVEAGLQVQQGRLSARGTALAPIVLTSTADREGGHPSRGDWNGVILGSGSGGSVLEHVWVKYGYGLTIAGAAPTLSAFSAVYNASAGLFLTQGASLATRDAMIVLNEVGVRQTNTARLVISQSVIKNNGQNAAATGSATLVATQNWWGAALPAGVGNGVDASSPLTGEPLLTPALGSTDGQTEVGSRQVALKLACRTAEGMRVSEDSSFAGVFFGPFATTLTFSLSEGAGQKTVYAQFRSPTGQTNPPLALTLNYITEGPVIQSFSLAEGQEISRPLEVTGKATAALGMEALEFHVDNALQQASTGSDLAWRWDMRAWPNGIHRVKLLARDQGGHLATLERNVVITPAPPAPPVVTTPATNTVFTASPIRLTGTAEPFLNINLTRNDQLAGIGTTDPQGNITFERAPLVEGLNRLVLVAVDPVGHVSSAPCNVVLDTGPPAAPILETPVYQAGLGLNVQWHLDATGEWPTRFQLFLHTAPFTNAKDATPYGPSLTEMASTIQGLKDGAYYLAVVGYDNAGNASLPSNRIQFEYDATPSQFTIAFGKSSPVGVGPLTVTLKSSEALAGVPSLTVKPHGAKAPIAIAVTNSGLLRYEGVFEVSPSLESGPATFDVAARDVAGNSFRGPPAGETLVIEVVPPAGSVQTVPSGPIQTVVPTNISVGLTLTKPQRPDSTPSLRFTPPAGAPVDVPLTGAGSNWLGTLSLPPAMGSGLGAFMLKATDVLGNVGTQIVAGASLEIYNTAVPTPPAAPSDLTAVAQPGGFIQLVWNTMPNAEIYRLYREAGPDPVVPTGLAADNLATNRYVDLPPADGVYRYAVTASRRGGESGVAKIVIVRGDRIPPDAPTNVTAELTATGVQIKWKAAPTGEYPAVFHLYRNGTRIQTTSGIGPLLDSPPRGVAQYVVGAADPTGNETRSAPVSLELLVGAVNDLQVLVNEGQAPAISWTSSDPTAVGFDLYRNGIKQNAVRLTGGAYVDLLPAETKPIEYTVRALNQAGQQSAPRAVQVYRLGFGLLANAMEGMTNRPLSIGYFDQFRYWVTNLTDTGAVSLAEVELRRTIAGEEAVAHTSPVSSTVDPGEWVSRGVVFSSADGTSPQSVRMRATQQMDAAGSRVIYQRLFDFPDMVSPGLEISLTAREQPLAGGYASFDLHLYNRGYAPMDVILSNDRGRRPGDLYISVQNDQGQEVSRLEYNDGAEGALITAAGQVFLRVPPQDSARFAITNVLVPESLAARPYTVFQAGIDRVYYALDTAGQLASGPLRGRMQSTLAQTAYYGTSRTDRPGYANDETILITGQAIDRASGSPVPHAALKLGFTTRGFQWFREVTTDANGDYRFEYEPPPGFGGSLSIWSAHPLVYDILSQKEVRYYRLYVSPVHSDITMSKNDTLEMTLSLFNPGDVPLTGFRAEVEAYRLEGTNRITITNLTAAIDWNPDFAIGPGETVRQKLTLAASANAPDQAMVQLTLRSAEGAADLFEGAVTLLPAVPILTLLNPAIGYVEVSLDRGQQISRALVVANHGLKDLRDVQLTPPTRIPWMSVNLPVSTDGKIRLPDIPVGESTSFQVVFAPPGDTAMDYFDDSLKIQGAGLGQAFEVRLFATVTSDQKGAVQFYVNNTLGQQVPAAEVRLRNRLFAQEVGPVLTDTNGLVTVPDLQEGEWFWQVSAPGHAANVGVVEVLPGQTVRAETMLARNLVTITFNVVPVSYTDRYEIKIEQTFETHVAAPVLVIDPLIADFGEIWSGFETNFVLTAKNHGLIQMTDLTIEGQEAEGGVLVPLITYIPVVRPQETIEIPFRFTYDTNVTSAPGLSGISRKARTAADVAMDMANCAIKVFPFGTLANAKVAKALYAIMNAEYRCVTGNDRVMLGYGLVTVYAIGQIGGSWGSARNKVFGWAESFVTCVLGTVRSYFVQNSTQEGARQDQPQIPYAPSPCVTPGFTSGNGACFAAGTQIRLLGGRYKPIESLREGDWVQTGLRPQDIAQVMGAYTATSDRLQNIRCRDRENPQRERQVQATPEHLFWVDGTGWTTAVNLKPGDWLCDEDGRSLEVVANSLRPLNPSQPVYSLRLKGDNALFANGILVHDLCGVADGASRATHLEPVK